MKKAFAIALVVIGVAFLGGGIYTALRGFDAKDQVRAELLAQRITTPEDAAIFTIVISAEDARLR